MTHSIIFINSPERQIKPTSKNFRQLFLVHPNELMFRMFASFVPPLGKKYRQVYVDFLGPILAFLFLTALIDYGFHLKVSKIGAIGPTEIVCVFVTCMPILCFVLSKLGNSTITLSETVSLVGYALFGHLLTLLVSFLCFQEKSNFFFFVCLIVFGGLSTLRLTLVILGTIPKPAARLLICTAISLVNILFLILIHFAFMHRTFVYNGALKKN